MGRGKLRVYLGVLGDQGSDLGRVQAMLTHDPGHLLHGVRGTDVQVESRAAARRRCRGSQPLDPLHEQRSEREEGDGEDHEHEVCHEGLLSSVAISTTR